MKTTKSFVQRLAGILMSTLIVSALVAPSTVFADSTVSNGDALKISYQATVLKDMNDTTTVKKKVYVNMYKIKLVDNEYVGKRVKTLSTGKDGYQAVFTIKPGEVVQFIAFKNKATAKKLKNKTKKTADFFGVPPWKNFSVAGEPVELCHTAGVDFNNKLTDEDTGKIFCTTAENGYIQGYLELTK